MKRIITFIITVVLLCGMVSFLPMNAVADSGGSCGAGLKWEYDASTKTLTVFGTGEMDRNIPWRSLSSEVERLIIGEGVTSLCNNAFSGFTLISEVSFPSTMKKVGDSAFSHTVSLESVMLNEGLKSLGGSCFCKSAFKNITLPSTLESVGVRCFDCDVVDIFVKAGNEHFSSRGGVLFSYDQTAIYRYGGGRTATSYRIPDTVNTIMPCAFANCTYLENVVFPRELVNIGHEAFEGSAIYNNQANWEDGLLYHNGALLAVERWKGGDIEVKHGTRIIAAYAFNQSDRTTTGGGMYRNITLPDSLVAIGDAAFANSSVKRLVIPKSVTKLGKYAFNYLTCEVLVILRSDLYLNRYLLGVQDKSLSAYDRLNAGEFSGAIGGAVDSVVQWSAGVFDYDFYPMGFADVTAQDWYYSAVEYVTENGILMGTGAMEFSPDTVMTRAMLITALWRIDGSTKVRVKDIPYTDLKDDYYTYAVHWAHKHGITNGTSGTTFSPDDTVTREQAVTILYRYAAYKGQNVVGEADMTRFPDLDKLGAYAFDSMTWACDKGIVKGNKIYGVDHLDPKGGTSRAQLAMMLKRFLTL